ncbi:MAG: hypothetical protein DK306_000605 [Chloroflexi bacterium]|nr:MAG: hypothetical protein DK306_000605 [Chloroflexota bacterium]
MLRLFGIMLLGIMVIGAACGGGDDNDDDGDSTSTSPAAAAPASDDSDADDDGNEGSGNSGGSGGGVGTNLLDSDCRFVIDGGIDASNLIGAGGTGSFQDIARTWQEIADRAPGDIKAAMQVMAGALQDLADDLDGIDLTNAATLQDPAVQVRLANAGESLDSDAFNTAQDEVEVWFDENCGG